MIRNRQFILSTSIILGCTLYSTLTFANTIIFQKSIKENAGSFWPQVKVENKTRFTAHVKIIYSLCKNDVFDISPGATGTGKSTLSRAGCLITKIETTFDRNGAATVSTITNFGSTGTGAADFMIEESALDEQETKFECMVYRKDKEGMRIGVKPGFIVWNNTKVPVEVWLKAGSGYYHSMVLPGKKFEKTTGAIWFTVKIEVSLDGKPKEDDLVDYLLLPFNWFIDFIDARILGKTKISFEGDNLWAGLGMNEILLYPTLKVGNDTTTAIEVNKSNIKLCEDLVKNSGSAVTLLNSQYAGPDEFFSKETEKPTYEITGGIYYDHKQNLIVTEKLCLKKVNTASNNMMKLSKKSTCD